MSEYFSLAPAVFAVGRDYQIMMPCEKEAYFAGCGYVFGENDIMLTFTDSRGEVLKEERIEK